MLKRGLHIVDPFVRRWVDWNPFSKEDRRSYLCNVFVLFEEYGCLLKLATAQISKESIRFKRRQSSHYQQLFLYLLPDQVYKRLHFIRYRPLISVSRSNFEKSFHQVPRDGFPQHVKGLFHKHLPVVAVSTDQLNIQRPTA